MSIKEFSDQFDTQIASYMQSSFGKQEPLAFDEYEKSVFLTKAQEQLVISLYNGRNSNGDSFESSEELRRYLSPLVMHKVDTTTDATDHLLGNDSYAFKLPSNLLFIVYEDADWDIDSCLPHNNVQVQPITHDEYHKIKNNPFRGANDHRVLRLDSKIDYDESLDFVELISKYPIKNYRYRYLRKPKPIILENLDGVSINGQTVAQTSELNSSLHERILELAVRLALQSRSINTNQQ